MATNPIRKIEEDIFIREIDNLISELMVIKRKVNNTRKGKGPTLSDWGLTLKKFKKLTKDVTLRLQVFIGELA